MEDNKWISASEIRFYTFCPRAWALEQLEYESDNQWEMEEGTKYHEETGRQTIAAYEQAKPLQTKLRHQTQILTSLIILVLLCIMAVLVRLIVK